MTAEQIRSAYLTAVETISDKHRREIMETIAQEVRLKGRGPYRAAPASDNPKGFWLVYDGGGVNALNFPAQPGAVLTDAVTAILTEWHFNRMGQIH